MLHRRHWLAQAASGLSTAAATLCIYPETAVAASGWMQNKPLGSADWLPKIRSAAAHVAESQAAENALPSGKLRIEPFFPGTTVLLYRGQVDRQVGVDHAQGKSPANLSQKPLERTIRRKLAAEGIRLTCTGRSSDQSTVAMFAAGEPESIRRVLGYTS